VATWSYADRAVHSDKPCASFTGGSPQCSRQPVVRSYAHRQQHNTTPARVDAVIIP